jgi:hypothetical protein
MTPPPSPPGEEHWEWGYRRADAFGRDSPRIFLPRDLAGLARGRPFLEATL